MIFTIYAQKSQTDKAIFLYDNEKNTLSKQDGSVYRFDNATYNPPAPFTPFSKDLPLKKSKQIDLLKIQLGLGCNYTCDYCSQKFVERPQSTSKKDVDDFISKLAVLEFSEDRGLKIEFWGGEPLVYWKTLKPLVESIKEKFAHWKKQPQFSMITNGSLLNDEIIDWLMMNDFSVAMSHDGGGQAIRGIDPFDDPELKERILGFYRMSKRLGKQFSFNAMLTKNNYSRKEIYDWFVKLTGDPDVILGEGSIVDAYDEDGITNSLTTKQDHFKFRQTAVKDILSTQGKIGFTMQLGKIDEFVRSVLLNAESKYLGQKCGMDEKSTLAVDLLGNVITCQNVSAVETAKNGESHLAGTLTNYQDVEIKTSTHWSQREECPKCPVLHLCKGACMYLDNQYWKTSCANSYSDNVALFALAIEKITGYLPTLIKHDELPLERQDIFGAFYNHPEEKPKKTIPIKVISEKVEVIDNVEIYGKARVAA